MQVNLNGTRYYPAKGLRGAVVAGHPLAVSTGARILMAGGTAVDAAIAVSATLTVVRPQMCGLGGDLLALVRRADDQSVTALNANGAAPLAVDVGRMRQDGIPTKGPDAATVPAVVAGWEVLMQDATLPLDVLLADAIHHAEHGFPTYPRLGSWISRDRDIYDRYPASRELFLSSPDAPVFRQPRLAAVLRRLVAAGLRDFYEGEVGAALASAVQADGGSLTAADLAECAAAVGAPLSADAWGVRIHESPPTSQGYLVLQMLGVLGRALPHGASQEEIVHAMVEAKKLAFQERLDMFGDPDFADVPIDRLLSEDHAAELVGQMGPQAGPSPGEQTPGDTTVFAVVDEARNAVTGIQSLFVDSGYVAGDTGVLLNGRLQGFSTVEDHPNALAPGKRPASTLNVWLATTPTGELACLGGSPGGHGQVQTNIQVLHRLLVEGLEPQVAVEAPRWIHGSRIAVRGHELAMEARFDERVVEGLAARGHVIRRLPDWAEISTGSAKVIAVRDGVLSVGVDPRRDAAAMAF